MTINDLDATTLRSLAQRGLELKRQPELAKQCLRGQTLVLMMEKPSTRTRVSFEVAAQRLGGQALFLSSQDAQFGHKESLADTARVLSGMAAAVVLRMYEQKSVETFAAYASIPVINGLTDEHHPCQILGDLTTWLEHRGDLNGAVKIVWYGDCSNVCTSWAQAARLLELDFSICAPRHLQERATALASWQEDPLAAAEGADLIMTDVWFSMGQEVDSERQAMFAPYQVSERVMDQASPDALFMHCLPALRGMEVAEAVIDGSRSVCWNQAHNRLHAEMALLEWLL